MGALPSFSVLSLLLFPCLLLFSLFTRPVQSWSSSGHVLVGQIALNTLKDNFPLLVDQVQAVLQEDAGYFNCGLLPAAGFWLDEIRGDSSLFDPMHYINSIYNPDGLQINFTLPDVNILWALSRADSRLRSSSVKRWGKTQNLRVLVHLVGDLHQPNHAAGLFNAQFPEGDLGANLYLLNYTDAASGRTYTQMHSWTDAVAGQYWQSIPDPLTDDYLEFIAEQASLIQGEFPLSSYEFDLYDTTNYTLWAQESYALAVSELYEKIPYGSNVSTEDIERLRPILRERLALAGYRLAFLFNQLDLELRGPSPSTGAADDEDFFLNQKTAVGLTFFCTALVMSCTGFLVGRKTRLFACGSEASNYRDIDLETR